MPYEFTWLDEPHYYQATLTGNITYEELDEWMTRVYDLLEQNHNMLSVVMDMTAHPKFSFNAMKLPTMQRVARHPNTGWVVVVGASPLINFWLEALHKFTNLKFRVFNNLEDARDFLAGIRRVEQEQALAQQV